MTLSIQNIREFYYKRNQIAYDANDTAENQSKPGYVIPRVRASTKRINLARGNSERIDLCPGERWFVIAILRPFIKAAAE